MKQRTRSERKLSRYWSELNFMDFNGGQNTKRARLTHIFGVLISIQIHEIRLAAKTNQLTHAPYVFHALYDSSF